MSERVLICKRQAPEALHAPEFQELLRSTVREARAVFGEADLLAISGDSSVTASAVQERAAQAEYLLLLDRGQVLLRRGTLAAMKRALLAGDGAPTSGLAAAPYELAGLPQEVVQETLTMGAFDRLMEEGTALAGAELVSQQALLLPTAAVSRAAVERWLAGHGDLAALADSWDVEVRPAGIAHTFIDYYGEERPEVLEYVPEFPAAAPGTLLEVGCGRGLTGALLRRERGLHVTGLELNPEVAADAAQRLDEVLVGDVLAIEPPQRYDVILALELFEHLTDGHAFLERARNWLRPGGRVVLSVPNVGHWSVVEELLRGRWDYLPMGLLCTTHHRFFTRRTLVDWIEAAGFARYRIEAQQGALPHRFDDLVQRWQGDAESLATLGFWAVLQAP